MKMLVVIFCLFAVLPAAFGQIDDTSSLAKLDAITHPQHDLVAEITITGFKDKTSSISNTYRLFFSGKRESLVLVHIGKNADRGIAYLYKDAKASAYLPLVQAFFPIPAFRRIDDSSLCIEDLFFPTFSMDYAIVSSEQVKIETLQSPAIKLGLKAKAQSQQGKAFASYPELAVFLDQKTGLVLSIEAYDDESHLVKTIRYSGFRAINDSFVPTRILVIDAIDNGAAALVTFQTTIAADIPDYVFTRPYIEYLVP